MLIGLEELEVTIEVDEELDVGIEDEEEVLEEEEVEGVVATAVLVGAVDGVLTTDDVGGATVELGVLELDGFELSAAYAPTPMMAMITMTMTTIAVAAIPALFRLKSRLIFLKHYQYLGGLFMLISHSTEFQRVQTFRRSFLIL